MTDHTGLEPRVVPTPPGVAWTGEKHAVFDGGTSGIGYHMDPSSYSIYHGPRPPSSTPMIDDGSPPSLYDERSVRATSDFLGIDESYVAAGFAILGMLGYAWSRRRRTGPCPPQEGSYGLALRGGKRAPAQKAPYASHVRLNEDGSIRQITLYDQYGTRTRQYDIGRRQRHGEEVHVFEYNAIAPRLGDDGGGIRHAGIPLNEQGI